MKNGIGYISLTDGKMHFLIRKDRNAEPLLLSMNVESVDAALAAARNYALDNGIPFEKAVVAMDGRTCFLRNYHLPIRGRRQLDQAVAFELADDLPLNLDDLVTDYCPGEYSGGVSFVSVAAAQKEHVAELIREFEAQDVTLESLDVDVAAFARACAARFAEHEHCVGLEIGRDRTLFCSLVKGKVHALSIIPWGESAVIDDYSKKSGLSAEEGERLLVLGKVSGDGEDISKQVDDSLGKFVRRILREVYRLLGDAEWPSRFVVSGEVVRFQRFRGVFESVSEVGLDIWDEQCLKLGDEVDEGQRGNGLAVGYGLTETSGCRFNFCKEEFAAAGGANSWTREVAFVAAMLVVAGLAWGGYAYATLVSGNRDLDYLTEATLQVYKTVLPGVNQDLSLEQYESILSSRQAMITGDGSAANDNSVTVIETLRVISSVLNKKIDVEFLGLSLDSRRIDVQGEAATMNEVDGIRAALAKAKAFKGVKVKNAVTNKRTKRIRFEIEVER